MLLYRRCYKSHCSKWETLNTCTIHQTAPPTSGNLLPSATLQPCGTDWTSAAPRHSCSGGVQLTGHRFIYFGFQ